MEILTRRLRPRLILAGVVIVALASLSALWGHAIRSMRRAEMSYSAEMERLNRDQERRLRESIALLREDAGHGPSAQGVTDQLFEMLRVSPVANKSREVEAWRKAPQSRERAAVALKWAEVAADEAAYMAALHEHWRQDYERGRMPHHVTEQEVPPFQMPDGWTEDDLKWGRVQREKSTESDARRSHPSEAIPASIHGRR